MLIIRTRNTNRAETKSFGYHRCRLESGQQLYLSASTCTSSAVAVAMNTSIQQRLVRILDVMTNISQTARPLAIVVVGSVNRGNAETWRNRRCTRVMIGLQLREL